MVGPFMQGMLLLGIIYWYSKGMMSLINDYYRGEFQRKLKSIEHQTDGPTYDVEDLENLLNVGEHFVKRIDESLKAKVISNIHTPEVCFQQNNYYIFMNLVSALAVERNSLNQHREVCWIDKVNVDKTQLQLNI